LKSFYITDSLNNHENINDQLLKDINQSGSATLNHGHDRITKLDWQYAHNANRYWVKGFMPILQSKLEEIMGNLGYQRPVIHELWFQQYSKDDTHDWHIHGHNFTGVYYVKAEKNCGNIVFHNSSDREFALQTYVAKPNQFSMTNVNYEPVVGKVLVFPSWLQHSVDSNMSNTDRISISFQFGELNR
jgi:hypothetical protein